MHCNLFAAQHAPINNACVIYVLGLPPGIAAVTNFSLRAWDMALLTSSW